MSLNLDIIRVHVELRQVVTRATCLLLSAV